MLVDRDAVDIYSVSSGALVQPIMRGYLRLVVLGPYFRVTGARVGVGGQRFQKIQHVQRQQTFRFFTSMSYGNASLDANSYVSHQHHRHEALLLAYRPRILFPYPRWAWHPRPRHPQRHSVFLRQRRSIFCKRYSVAVLRGYLQARHVLISLKASSTSGTMILPTC